MTVMSRHFVGSAIWRNRSKAIPTRARMTVLAGRTGRTGRTGRRTGGELCSGRFHINQDKGDLGGRSTVVVALSPTSPTMFRVGCVIVVRACQPAFCDIDAQGTRRCTHHAQWTNEPFLPAGRGPEYVPSQIAQRLQVGRTTI